MTDPAELPEALQPQDPEPRDLRPLVALAFIPWVLIAVGLKLADKI